jgi:hypothetical protein
MIEISLRAKGAEGGLKGSKLKESGYKRGNYFVELRDFY